MTQTETAERKTPTFCRICEAICGLEVTVADGKVKHIGPDRQHPVSAGHLCVKGPAIQHVAYDPDRVLTPLKRVGGVGEFAPVGWDEALDDIAARLAASAREHGGDSVGAYFGNPASFFFQHMSWTMGLLTRLGSSKIYSPVHVDTGAKALACKMVYGPAYPYTFPELEDCDFLLMLGANPMISHMSLITEPRALHRLEAIARRGSVVVVDPRRSETARRFEHLAIPPDTDVWLLAGILATLIEDDLVRHDILAEKVVGWEPFASAIRRIRVEDAARHCRLPAGEIRALARRFAAARTAACYGRIGTNRGTFPTLINVMIEAINIATGRFGEPGGWLSRPSPFKQMGSIYRPTAGDPRSRIGDLPLVGPFQPGGGLADDILTPGDGQMRALLVDSGNPAMAYPDGHKMERALAQLDLLVSLDFYVNETSKYAHYVLPTPTFIERPDLNDLMIGRATRPCIQYTDAVIPPLGDSRMEVEIYNELFHRMGVQPLYPQDMPAEEALIGMIDTYLAGVTMPDGSTLNVARMREEFPRGYLVDGSTDGATVWERITHEDGKAHLWSDVIAGEMQRLAEATAAPADQRIKLFGRRKLRSINSWMHNDPRMVRSDKPTLIMHPDDAEARQIRDGDIVAVSNRHGRVEVPVEISDEVIAGSVNYPHGWGHAGGWQHANSVGGVNINLLASSDPKDWEQVSGMCLIDGIPVEVHPIPVPR